MLLEAQMNALEVQIAFNKTIANLFRYLTLQWGLGQSMKQIVTSYFLRESLRYNRSGYEEVYCSNEENSKVVADVYYYRLTDQEIRHSSVDNWNGVMYETGGIWREWIHDNLYNFSYPSFFMYQPRNC